MLDEQSYMHTHAFIHAHVLTCTYTNTCIQSTKGTMQMLDEQPLGYVPLPNAGAMGTNAAFIGKVYIRIYV